MSLPASDSLHAYRDLRDRGARAVEAGRNEEAFGLFEQAWAEAQAIGDQDLVDRAFCNRSLALIALGRLDGVVGELRAILVRNHDAENCRLAAYHIARVYELEKQYKKALFYARISLQRAVELERSDWIASSHNSIGNILMAESFVDEACAEYEQALALSDATASVWRARIFDNVGYCRILQRRFGEGLNLLYRSLRALRRAGAELFQISTHLDLCFAHLELGRLRCARRHGERALELARRYGDTDSIKNALYLLGDAAQLAGDETLARSYFSRLHEHYPDYSPALTDFLVAVDVRKLVNLKA